MSSAFNEYLVPSARTSALPDKHTKPNSRLSNKYSALNPLGASSVTVPPCSEDPPIKIRSWWEST